MAKKWTRITIKDDLCSWILDDGSPYLHVEEASSSVGPFDAHAVHYGGDQLSSGDNNGGDARKSVEHGCMCTNDLYIYMC